MATFVEKTSFQDPPVPQEKMTGQKAQHKKELRGRRQKKAKSGASNITTSQLLKISLSFSHLAVQHRVVRMDKLFRFFYRWKETARLTEIIPHPSKNQQVGIFLTIFDGNEANISDTIRTSKELTQREKLMRQSGTRVVIRRFVKRRLFVRMQMALSKCIMYIKSRKHSEKHVGDIEEHLEFVRSEEEIMQQCFETYKSLQLSLLVFLFHLKWKSNSKLFLLKAHKRDKDDFKRLCSNEVKSLLAGICRSNTHEQTFLRGMGPSHLGEGAVLSVLGRLCTTLEDLE